MKLNIELDTHELTEGVLGSIFQLAKQVSAQAKAAPITNGARANAVTTTHKVGDLSVTERVETITPNLAPIAPADMPDVGAPVTDAQMTMLGFGPGSAPPPPGAVSVPAPAAPAPIPQAAPQISGAQLDSKGTPWNAEIHSTPAVLKDNGEWRSKRGVDKNFAATQAEQLRRMHAASVGAAPVPQAPVTVTAVPAPPAPVTPPAPPAPPVTPPAPPAPPAPPSAFAKFMQAITPYMIGSGQPTACLSDADLCEIAKTLGLVDAQGNGSVSLLQSREELIPNFGEWINYKVGQINAARAT